MSLGARLAYALLIVLALQVCAWSGALLVRPPLNLGFALAFGIGSAWAGVQALDLWLAWRRS